MSFILFASEPGDGEAERLGDCSDMFEACKWEVCRESMCDRVEEEVVTACVTDAQKTN